MMSRIMMAAILTANSDHLLTHCAVLAASVFSYAHTRQRIAFLSAIATVFIVVRAPPANSTFLSEETNNSNQSVVLFSHNKPVSAISHQPNEQAGCFYLLPFCPSRSENVPIFKYEKIGSKGINKIHSTKILIIDGVSIPFYILR
jgi:hypothetical protein